MGPDRQSSRLFWKPCAPCERLFLSARERGQTRGMGRAHHLRRRSKPRDGDAICDIPTATMAPACTKGPSLPATRPAPMLEMTPISLAHSVRSRSSPAVARREPPHLHQRVYAPGNGVERQRRGEPIRGSGYALGMWTPLRYVLSSCSVGRHGG